MLQSLTASGSTPRGTGDHFRRAALAGPPRGGSGERPQAPRRRVGRPAAAAAAAAAIVAGLGVAGDPAARGTRAARRGAPWPRGAREAPTPGVGGGRFGIERLLGKGWGAVAERDLSPGELVAEEAPLLYVGADTSRCRPLQGQFDSLTIDQQALVMALHDAFMFDEKWSLEDVVLTNTYACREAYDEAILCPVCARFNHSCTPNCEQRWDEDTCSLRIYACTAIRKGTELCVCYVELRKSAAERAQELWDGYRFRCQCPACCDADALSDRRRVRLQQLDAEVGRIGPHNPRRGIQLVEETLSLLDMEGLHLNSLRKRECSYAQQLAVRTGNIQEAELWAERAEAYRRLYDGERYRENMQQQTSVGNLKSHAAVSRKPNILRRGIDSNAVLPIAWLVSLLAFALLTGRF